MDLSSRNSIYSTGLCSLPGTFLIKVAVMIECRKNLSDQGFWDKSMNNDTIARYRNEGTGDHIEWAQRNLGEAKVIRQYACGIIEEPARRWICFHKTK